ncbi:unnamed protein product [Vitrella brassicaformis CCMP3155]|uniref:Uncharacterized protein n=1 Tax=Vitrella brassicaformis (strain CCMP3155) TaxID=1169540 RepID=A0A0G4E8J0_VITBC|nr:unnamed protein product [Vitrella brassicaformis CCMP3155]|mmetsp:Transcript_14195/g.40820  ORF Transcript_14195/g.40820 Transcript_14195/m.40820 type:complete len:413 (-) Transcript_14195:245-1483(-)|eukprot:CEL91806.1 unnamed protein product [Vitrella brassicaformis CCMP3155]
MCHHLACGQSRPSSDQLAHFLVTATGSPNISDAIAVSFPHFTSSGTSLDEKYNGIVREWRMEPFRDKRLPFKSGTSCISHCACSSPLCSCGAVIFPSVAFTVATSLRSSPDARPIPPSWHFASTKAQHEEGAGSGGGNTQLREVDRFCVDVKLSEKEASRQAACSCISVHDLAICMRQGTSDVNVLGKSGDALTDRGSRYAAPSLYVSTLLGGNAGIGMKLSNLALEDLTAKGLADARLRRLTVKATIVFYPYLTVALHYLRRCILEERWDGVTAFARSLSDQYSQHFVVLMARLSFRPLAALTHWCKAMSFLESCNVAETLAGLFHDMIKADQNSPHHRSDLLGFIGVVVPLLSPSQRDQCLEALAWRKQWARRAMGREIEALKSGYRAGERSRHPARHRIFGGWFSRTPR